MKQRVISYILFLSSYIPLFLILFLQNLRDRYVEVGLVTLIAISFIGLIGFCFTYERKGRNKEIIVKSFENKGIDNLNYMSGYVIPFISLNMPIIVSDKVDIANVMSIIILFFVLGYLYVKSNLYYVNPILNLFYDISSIESVEGNSIILIGDKNKNFKSYDEFNTTHVIGNIYFGTMDRGKAVKRIIIVFILVMLILIIVINKESVYKILSKFILPKSLI